MTDQNQEGPAIDARFILAIGLSILILIGWQFLFPPSRQAPPPPSEAQPVEATPPPEADTARQEPSAPITTTEPTVAEPVQAQDAEEVVLENDLWRVALTNEGGRVASWRLKDFRGAEGSALELVPAAARKAGRLPLAFHLADAELARRLDAQLYRVEREFVSASEGASEGERVHFSWSDGVGLAARKSITLRRGSPLAEIEVSIMDRGRAVPVGITWGPGIEADDAANGGYMHYTGQAVIDVASGLPWRKTRQKLDEPFSVPEGAGARWAGLEEQYFAALIVPTGRAGPIVVTHEEIPTEANGKSKNEPQLVVGVGLEEGKARLFVGPKRYRELRALGLGLDNVVWFSSYGLIHWIATGLFLALTWVHDNTISNYGLAIVLSTLALRLILFPLNQYSMVRMRKVSLQMQRIQPKVKAIQQKYKKSKDPQARLKMNEETMALYRKEGVNPLGGMSGCLPMLAQFPILIAFYNVLTVAVELRGAPFFGWIRDLTLKDPFYVTPLLMGATMFVQQKMTPTTGMDPAQQRMMLVMPIIFTVMFLNLPSGLVLYWFVNNLLGIAQQWLVNRHMNRVQEAVANA